MKNLIIGLLLLSSLTLNAQNTIEPEKFDYSNRFSILAGLIQPTLLRGGNIEVNYFTNRISLDYSHGFSLDPPAFGEQTKQHLVSHLPFSTGFGIGYRFTSYLDLRVEPKLHSWEIYYQDEVQNTTTLIKAYKTFTLGLGLYYRYMPFKNHSSKFLQGITTSSSVRWWPNIGSTLSNDSFTYLNKITERTETMKAANIGMANTPFIINVGVGFTFGGK